MQKAFNLPSIETDAPLMYQGMSHQFLGPHDDVPLPSEADGIDFEGEFAVITDAVPMGVSVEEAADHIKLIVQLNDWSFRVLAPVEMKTGFGWVRAKPACSVAPFAVTPEELGSAWRDGRVCLNLQIDWNGQRFGAANGSAMEFGFDELVAHAAYSRSLPAGTIIGSGTVSNENCREVGSSCIAERRASKSLTWAHLTQLHAFRRSGAHGGRTGGGLQPLRGDRPTSRRTRRSGSDELRHLTFHSLLGRTSRNRPAACRQPSRIGTGNL